MKPLGHKAYGSIPHLPNSRMGPADHHCSIGQANICTVKPRDRHDLIVVQEKLDGSCCAVYRKGNEFLALTRAGHLAESSQYEQHKLFANWVKENEERFAAVLQDGERLVGEWLAQAHGTIYIVEAWNVFVPFDIVLGQERVTYHKFFDRVAEHFLIPACMQAKNKPMSVQKAMSKLGEYGWHDAKTPIEGAIWRVERKGKVDFLAKYVRPDKIDGLYLPEISGKETVWNWKGTNK